MILQRLYPLGAAGNGGEGFIVTLTPDEIADTVTLPVEDAFGSSTASASGGTAPYTYAWTYVPGSGSTLGVGVAGAATATCTFDISSASPMTRAFVYRCTATDANSATAFTDISVFLSIGA